MISWTAHDLCCHRGHGGVTAVAVSGRHNTHNQDGYRSFMFLWVYDLPTWLLFTLIVVGSLVVAWSGVFALRPVAARLFGDKDERNSMVELVLTGTGLFYGLLLGLISAATYTTFSDAQAAADTEAGVVAALYRDVSAYPEPIRGTMRAELETYVDYVINEAWPQQRLGIVPTDGIGKADALLKTMASFEPATPGQEAVHAEAFSQFNHFLEARRERLSAVTGGLPPALWWVLIAGAAINLVLIAMIDIDRVLGHLAVSGLFAVFVGMMIFLIAAMDNPFLGDYSVGPDAFEALRDQVLRR
ncbi:hypothetical protein CFP71_28430 [Amycolatopsis thailandensis]|uniref:DUF4239 domain-containing protein n=2 Tax=Amycolatopsis thailandensis TaxID=589330 RepID=A0A229RUJ5_9PSEU|nr:hypothetical protein CFP71_28430 [Amycolatopsis thailandensis]